jgi:uncharacterized protein YggE
MKRHRIALITLFAVATSLAAVSDAQESLKNAVAATGHASIERRPERLRVILSLQGQGATMKEALERLAAREAEARQKLDILSADPASIKLGEAEIPAGLLAKRQQMQTMLRQQVRSGGRRAKDITLPTSALASKELTAVWDVAADTSEQFLQTCHELVEKIQAADLGGASEADPVPPEVQEMLEEVSEMMQQYGNDGDTPENEPKFFYVSPITDEQQREVLARAFENAKQKAIELAAAAGMQLGELQHLSGGNANDASATEYYGGYPGYAYYEAMTNSRPATLDSQEALAVQPGQVRYGVSVQAVFALE